MEKKCNKCDITKNLNDFPKCPECKGGHRNTCKECIKGYSSVWRENNPEAHKKWVENNTEYDKERKRKHYEDNKELYIKRGGDYRKNNKEKITKWVSEYRKKRFSEDEVFKLTFVVRSRVRNFLKTTKILKPDTTFELIGCSPQELVSHIEKQFKDGMNWENHGEWHIDHIIPLSSAKTKEDLFKLCHYTNLQPLWAFDNLSKGAKL